MATINDLPPEHQRKCKSIVISHSIDKIIPDMMKNSFRDPDSGDQHPHPRPAGPLLNAPPDGAEPAPGGEPGTRQGEAHLAARPQGGGGLHVPADC